MGAAEVHAHRFVGRDNTWVHFTIPMNLSDQEAAVQHCTQDQNKKSSWSI